MNDNQKEIIRCADCAEWDRDKKLKYRRLAEYDQHLRRCLGLPYDDNFPSKIDMEAEYRLDMGGTSNADITIMTAPDFFCAIGRKRNKIATPGLPAGKAKPQGNIEKG